MIKIWVDDIRTPPSAEWVWIKSVNYAIQYITYIEGNSDFAALEEKKSSVQGVFFDGQLWDARMLIDEIIQTAKQSIILIDNWVSVSTLNMFASKNENVFLKIVTTPHRDKNGNLKQNISQEDALKFNAQYPKLEIIFNNTFHDRFLIIDDRDLYLIGASLKDLGKKCFGFTQLDSCFISDIKKRIY